MCDLLAAGTFLGERDLLLLSQYMLQVCDLLLAGLLLLSQCMLQVRNLLADLPNGAHIAQSIFDLAGERESRFRCGVQWSDVIGPIGSRLPDVLNGCHALDRK